MEINTLLKKLGLEKANEFKYFENFADLIEMDEEVDIDSIYFLVSEADGEVISEIVDSYFEEMMNVIPESQTELFTIMENIKRSITGLSKNREDENTDMKLAEEISNFKEWFSHREKVVCISIGKKEESHKTILEALSMIRLEKLGYEDYEYDFSDMLEYDLDEYSMNINDLLQYSDEDSLDNKKKKENFEDIFGEDFLEEI